MKTKYKIALLVFGLVSIYFYFFNFPVSSKKISSYALVTSYVKNETSANFLFANKPLEVEGFVEKISYLNNTNTVFLYGHKKSSSVLCDMKTNQVNEIKKLKKNQKVILKGICKGFLKDVILQDCVLINTKINE